MAPEAPHMSMIPRIFIQLDTDSGEFDLMCESHGRVAPAGPRLFRAPPHPRIKFHHETMADAEVDAQQMRTYLGHITKRSPSKSESRKIGA
jgi:hypothetical protein